MSSFFSRAVRLLSSLQQCWIVILALFEHIQMPGRGTFHLISFLPKKQARWSTQGSNSQDKNAPHACFSFDPTLPPLRSFWRFPLILYCHHTHCDHSFDLVLVIIAKISFDVALPSQWSFFWSCCDLIAKCSSVAACLFEYQEGCVPSNLEQSWEKNIGEKYIGAPKSSCLTSRAEKKSWE